MSSSRKCRKCRRIISFPYFNNQWYHENCSREITVAFYKKKCAFCRKSLRRQARRFCGHSCSASYIGRIRQQKIIREWKRGNPKILSRTIRKYLIEKLNGKCSECGWERINPVTNKSPLHVHHIDGNSRNNVIKNLTILCPNCHSLTPNHGSLNNGKGRGAFGLR